MKRRTFLQTAAATTALAGTRLFAADSSESAPDYYEIRTYHLDTKEKQSLVADYLKNAAFPAWKRLHLGPIGVFTEIGKEATPSMHVVLTYSSLKQFASARTDLEADTGYQSAAAKYNAAKIENPTFIRIESSLLVAFAGMPKIAPQTSKPRVLELRIYESHSEAKARSKVDMFNDGEIPIFENVGLRPVFFGETLIGRNVPNLKYMLQTEDLNANQAGWKRFVVDPDWVKMRDLPQYADTVSKITKIYLKPTDYSEI